MSKRLFLVLVLIVLSWSLISQLAFIPMTPTDWDEPVYTNVASGVLQWGYPTSFDLDLQGNPEYYPYHPPFHLFLLSMWYRLSGVSVESGREVGVIVYTSLIAFMMFFTWIITGNHRFTLLAGLLYSFDGWLKYSGLLVKIDTMSALIGVTGIFFFILCWGRRSRSLAIVSGILIGTATAYKHVGGIVLVTLPIHLVLVSDKKSFNAWIKEVLSGLKGLHGIAIGSATIIVILYFIYMVVAVGDPFIDATWVQIRRTLGLQEARGLDYGLDKVLQALLQTYWSFGGTLLFLGFGIVCTVVSFWQHIRGRELWRSLLTAWAIAAIVTLVGIRLKNPHYLSHAILPLHLVSILHLFLLWKKGKVWRLLTFGFIVLVIVANLFTLGVRWFAFSNADALEETRKVIIEELSGTAVILADEPICAWIPQPCFRIGQYQDFASLRLIQPDYVVIYSSITQSPPDSDAVVELLSNTSEIPGIPEITDWKARIKILEVNPEYWNR